jgi:hypothetical protein
MRDACYASRARASVRRLRRSSTSAPAAASPSVPSGRHDRGPGHPPRPRVDGAEDASVGPADRELRPVEPQHEVRDPALVGQRHTNAVRDAADGVERVHERIAARVRVERVDPAPVPARDPGGREALHDPALLRLVGDPAGKQPVGPHVVGAHDVVAVAPVGHLDQVEPRGVGRESVEGEPSLQDDPLADAKRPRVGDEERRRRDGESGEGQEEHPPVAREALTARHACPDGRRAPEATDARPRVDVPTVDRDAFERGPSASAAGAPTSAATASKPLSLPIIPSLLGRVTHVRPRGRGRFRAALPR